MTISRRGRMSKWDKIQKTIKNAHDIHEVYILLEQFRLTSAEERQIAQAWQKEQEMLSVHNKGVYATPIIQVVA